MGPEHLSLHDGTEPVKCKRIDKRRTAPSGKLSILPVPAVVGLVPILLGLHGGAFQSAPAGQPRYSVTALMIFSMLLLGDAYRSQRRRTWTIIGSLFLTLISLIISAAPVQSGGLQEPAPTTQMSASGGASSSSGTATHDSRVETAPVSSGTATSLRSSWSDSVKDDTGRYVMTVRIDFEIHGTRRKWTTIEYRIDGPVRAPVSVDWRLWTGPESDRNILGQRQERQVIIIGRQYSINLEVDSEMQNRGTAAVSFTLDPETVSRKRWFSVSYDT